jgi:hypothetical protein
MKISTAQPILRQYLFPPWDWHPELLAPGSWLLTPDS